MLDKRAFYIDGQWVAPVKPNDLEVINPSNEEPCAVISLGGQADTDAAVVAARAAFGDWSLSDTTQRIEWLERLGAIYQDRADEMGEAISMEMGAPVSLAKSAQSGAGSWHIKNFIRTMKQFSLERELGPTRRIPASSWNPSGSAV